MSRVEIEHRSKVYIVKINRPEARNAVDAETADLLEQAVSVFKRDGGLRVMVLTGVGDVSFCAGADLKSAVALNDKPQELAAFGNRRTDHRIDKNTCIE